MTTAEQAAREIAEKICSRGFGDVSHYLRDQFAEYIKAGIDRSVAETEEKFRKLARKWHAAYERDTSSMYRSGRDDAAFELESLIPKQEGEK